eukprot:gnl/MRDRNA2_/MRDRNA2_86689_c0_seq4.p1 gnl/MRDRNA2_/MRDRNA2_86689_c0~~gnl/MRDRNA2_/MRDRNA2_86689_c0_seq4.p1  ORF type:complete len:1394 (+),score=316.51 gnl/MRDRNA2_/MRDRNA2_86689_c0_seq4:94-4182(+)
MASLQLTDLSKVKQIGTFTERLRVVKPCPELGEEAALDVLKLATAGYANDVAAALTKLVDVKCPKDAVIALKDIVQSFVDLELPFQGSNDDDEIIGGLAKSNKDDLAKVVPMLIARKQVKYRTQVLGKVLSEMASLVTKLMTEVDQADQSWFFSEVKEDVGVGFDDVKADLMATLQALVKLQGKVYGEAQLKTNQLLESLSIPSFKERLENLASQLKSGSADLDAVSKEPNLSVSVNLLTVLMSHSEEIVRKAAMEVYIRRVHRADLISSMTIKEISMWDWKDPLKFHAVLTATWDFTIRPTQGMGKKQRHGFAAILPDFDSLDSSMAQIIETASAEMPKSEPSANVLYVGFRTGPEDENAAAAGITQILQTNKAALDAMNLRNGTVFIVHPGKNPSYFNFYASTGYQEEATCRNMSPTMALLLELNRLTNNYDLTCMPTLATAAKGRNSQMYLATEKVADKKRGGGLQALFLRSVSHSKEDIMGAEDAILLAFNELDRARLDPRVQSTTSSRFFLNILPHDRISLDKIGDIWQSIMEGLISKHATRLLELNVDEIEVKVRVKEGDEIVPVRLVASSSSGGWMQPSAYREFHDPITGVTEQYCNLIGDAPDRMMIGAYSGSSPIQTKRVAARRAGSTYAHDFLGLLDVALIVDWQKHLEKKKGSFTMPKRLLVSQELILDKEGNMVATERMPGENKIGMLAWMCTIKTPLYPEGRDIVIIANDVTVQSGSFGVLEDDFFYKASEYARTHGLPRIFISCNSGARIGLVEDLKPKFQVQWKDKSNPALGFEYLYLAENDYKSLPEGTVKAEPKVVNGETQYVLTAIIGQIHGIGVENLRGSGMIAGETSRAYDETFTLSYVTGRSVGIGAYLNRLGQRVIQMKQGPMILTGYSALNKLLGKEVYTSQDQLGGPQIMYPNGISHQVVEDDREGMAAVLDWINYTPKDFNSLQPIPEGAEDPSRPIDFMPSKTPYDPRHMLAGTNSADGSFVSGFLDKDSFKEYMGGWGKSVIAGRGRLGGINVGVIAVETRLVEQRIPADPGNSESREDVKPQAGQVWYPDSAYKTAQAIEDFNRGENLPLIIFANWRGFSGGTRDMYGEILKFGSMIVDALRTYKHPVFIYIPPNGELRGGAWVVLDPTINPAKMEMYADTDARGGILEPPGICEVKYRKPDQVAAAHRMDPILKELDDDLAHCSDPAENKRIASDIADRENTLAPVYLNVAHEFADLHDRAGRMKAKNCIREELQWKSSRSFFYWRIRRRISEDAFKDRLIEASGGKMTLSEANAKVLATLGSDMDDQAAAAWYESNAKAMDAVEKAVRVESTASTVSKLLAGLSDEDKKSILGKAATMSFSKDGFPGFAMGA